MKGYILVYMPPGKVKEPFFHLPIKTALQGCGSTFFGGQRGGLVTVTRLFHSLGNNM